MAFHPSRIALSTKRLPMTRKQGRQYYRGTGVGTLGNRTKHGGFVVDYDKVRTFMVPPLNNTELSMFVPKTLKRPQRRCGAFTADDYLGFFKGT